MKRNVSIGTTILLVILTALLTFSLTYLVFIFSQGSFIPFGINSKYDEVMAYIDTFYIADYDKSELEDKAVEGIVNALPDKWSRYMTADEYKDSLDPTIDDYVGIGVQGFYDENEGAIRVTAVHNDSPAIDSGIKFYDLIMSIDGSLVSDLGFEESIARIRGEEGSTVTITYYSVLEDKTNTVTLRRSNVTQTNLYYELLDNKIGYINIHKFEEGVDVQFKTAIEELISNGALGLIFDVRFNPGGRLDVMKNMLDPLLPEGVIIEQQNKSGESSVIMSDSQELNIPMAVLVNEYSYSAAEFFAATLKEYQKAVIVGTKTSGKSYSQRTYPLSDGSALVLSSFHYFTPKGVDLAENGVTPDIICEISEDELYNLFYTDRKGDSQLMAAVDKLISDK